MYTFGEQMQIINALYATLSNDSIKNKIDNNPNE
jgi:hypothetical protein